MGYGPVPTALRFSTIGTTSRSGGGRRTVWFEPAHPKEWIRYVDQKWFFGDGDPPWRNRKSRRRCEKALDDFKHGRPLVGMQSD